MKLSSAFLSAILALIVIVGGCTRIEMSVSSTPIEADTSLQLAVGKVTVGDGTHPQTTISIAIPEESRVVLESRNATGYLVYSMVDEVMPVGYYEFVWSAVDNDGNQIGSGIYFIHLVAYTSTSKLEQWRPLVFCRTEEDCEGLIDEN